MRGNMRPLNVSKSGMSRLLLACGVALAALGLGSCKNAFEEASVKNSNEGYYFDAQQFINSRDYDSAITKLNALTPEFKARRDVTVIIASAYAGRCGLDFLSLAKSISDNPSMRIFPVLLQNFKLATTGSIADCNQAETWMRTLAPTNNFASMTPDEAAFLAMVSLSKIGATLGTYADLDDDGVADVGFDSCNTTQLPDLRTRNLAVSLNIAAAALSASGAAVGGSTFTSLSSACASFPAGTSFCGIYDPTALTVNQVKVFNGLVKAQDIAGVGTCPDTTQNCTCP